jgi:hypothetical protein
MKRAFLLIVVPALLVALGFAQTPAASSNADQTTIKGCLGGSDGNYTVVEDNTGHTFKITTSSVDLKPHLNHDITLIGHKASGTGSSPADNSLAVTEVKMISEHCTVAAALSTAPVTTPSETAGTPAAPPAATAPAASVSALPETVSTPATAAAAPATATTPAATATTPAADATPPTAPVTPPAETAVAPAADATSSAAPVTAPAETAVKPAAAAAVPVATIKTPAKTASTPASRPRKPSDTPVAATTTPAVTASAPAATAVIPVATDSPSPEPVNTPTAVAPKPTPASNGWSFWLLIVFGVLVVVVGTMFPFLNRWRKQRNLERTDAPNLSFNREASSGQNKSDQGMSEKKPPRKAA